jgi:AcrR family transcriptional regulator
MADGTRVSGEPARERILDAAEQLFAHHGFDATPTSRVAAEAGVPKGLLFYHFARKIDLLTALFAERMPVAVPHDAREVVRPGDVAGSLLDLAGRLEASLRGSRLVRTILWREADTHPEVARCLHAFHDELVEFATKVIALADPRCADQNVRHAAALAWTGTVTLALNTARLGGTEHDLPVVAGLLAAGLVAASGSAGGPRSAGGMSTAVDREHLAGDVAGALGGQEAHRPGDVVGASGMSGAGGSDQ